MLRMHRYTSALERVGAIISLVGFNICSICLYLCAHLSIVDEQAGTFKLRKQDTMAFRFGHLDALCPLVAFALPVCSSPFNSGVYIYSKNSFCRTGSGHEGGGFETPPLLLSKDGGGSKPTPPPSSLIVEEGGGVYPPPSLDPLPRGGVGSKPPLPRARMTKTNRKIENQIVGSLTKDKGPLFRIQMFFTGPNRTGS